MDPIVIYPTITKIQDDLIRIEGNSIEGLVQSIARLHTVDGYTITSIGPIAHNIGYASAFVFVEPKSI